MSAEILSDRDLDLIFRTARSYGTYQDRPVGETQLRAVWDLMKMGPTSVNSQPVRLFFCTTAEAKEKLAALASGNNGDKIREAPVTAIVGMATDFYNELPRLFPPADIRGRFAANEELAYKTAFRNSSLQGAYLIIAARAIGLDVGPMSGFDNEAVDQAFFTGTAIRSNFIATIGYGDPTSLKPRLPRASFDEFCHIL